MSKMAQTSTACFQDLRLSFFQFDVSYCEVPLPEAALMLGYNQLFSTIERILLNRNFPKTMDKRLSGH
jgi:hypothetical protein